MLSKSTKVKVQILGTIEHEIHALIKVFPSNVSRIISPIYASVKLEEHLVLWKNLKNIALTINLAWVVMMDFIILMKFCKTLEKRGAVL